MISSAKKKLLGGRKNTPPANNTWCNSEFSPVEGGGKQRTEMHCHECRKEFVAELDFDIDGDHIIECPHCLHEHCRQIKNGKVTGERWDSRPQRGQAEVARASTWKSNVIQAQTSSVSHFMRELWLQNGQ